MSCCYCQSVEHSMERCTRANDKAAEVVCSMFTSMKLVKEGSITILMLSNRETEKTALWEWMKKTIHVEPCLIPLIAKKTKATGASTNQIMETMNEYWNRIEEYEIPEYPLEIRFHGPSFLAQREVISVNSKNIYITTDKQSLVYTKQESLPNETTVTQIMEKRFICWQTWINENHPSAPPEIQIEFKVDNKCVIVDPECKICLDSKACMKTNCDHTFCPCLLNYVYT